MPSIHPNITIFFVAACADSSYASGTFGIQTQGIAKSAPQQINPKLGIINPIMGMNQSPASTATSLADALFPRVRQRVLAVLFGTPDRSFYANEVIALAQSGTGAVQRELAGLSEAGLLTVSKQGNQKHYQANADAPVFAELRGLVLKTMDVDARLVADPNTATQMVAYEMQP